MLKRAEIVTNFDTDEAVIFGKKLTLEIKAVTSCSTYKIDQQETDG